MRLHPSALIKMIAANLSRAKRVCQGTDFIRAAKDHSTKIGFSRLGSMSVPGRAPFARPSSAVPQSGIKCLLLGILRHDGKGKILHRKFSQFLRRSPQREGSLKNWQLGAGNCFSGPEGYGVALPRVRIMGPP